MKKINSEINIEGSAIVNNHFILSNRANLKNPINHLVITRSNFWEVQKRCAISVATLIVSDVKGIGVSELCYVQSRDMLLMTLTSEQTGNAYDDGVIGDSYIGWVDQISKKLIDSSIRLDGIINLSLVDEKWKGQKIEGLCISDGTTSTLVVHMVSDNDMGQTQLFKVRLTFR